jgi:hypothetical protein
MIWKVVRNSKTMRRSNVWKIKFEPNTKKGSHIFRFDVDGAKEMRNMLQNMITTV